MPKNLRVKQNKVILKFKHSAPLNYLNIILCEESQKLERQRHCGMVDKENVSYMYTTDLFRHKTGLYCLQEDRGNYRPSC